MHTASIVNEGELQSVCLPQGFHLDGTEVYVRRVGSSIVLIPVEAEPWDTLVESLDEFTDDYMEERNQPPQQQREALFE